MIRIIADTLSSISPDIAKQLDLDFLPQIVIFGEDSYRDDTEINSKQFLEKLQASSTLPKTAAPPPDLYTPFFQRLVDEKSTGIVICPSNELSGTYRSACVAAKDFPGADIRIIDTRLIGSGLGSVVFEAVRCLKNGFTADQIVQMIQQMSSKNETYFLVDTLEYLFKGGRIGGAKALFGSILQIKPILKLLDGRIEPADNQRTKQRAVARLKEIVLGDFPPSYPEYFSIMQGGASEGASELAAFFKDKVGTSEISIYEVPPAIIVHSGPGVLAVTYFKK